MKKMLFIFTIFLTVVVLSSCQKDNDNILRVGMDLSYPPFETVSTSNVPEGISVDIAMAFGEFLGRPVEIVNTDFGSLMRIYNLEVLI